ncbi:hypothetical protein [Halogeometricum limi]|uniref:Uncharacterized protein n=1 Tax=Halogeometricum limi TaxID=555875 RepID=A0A1I6I5B3_9EURY|nr:hypothetical protein [Halogeometricum limi]SFR61859.1 hypothetical protein SAMN04488124_2842 [Halogeometricum limi]
MTESVADVVERLETLQPREGLDYFVESLETEVGEGLRGVFYGDFETRSYQVAYANPTVLDDYSSNDVEDIVDDIALEQLTARQQEKLYEPLGELEVTVRVFEGGINVMGWGTTEIPTVYVGLDGDTANIRPATRLLRALFSV